MLCYKPGKTGFRKQCQVRNSADENREKIQLTSVIMLVVHKKMYLLYIFKHSLTLLPLGL